mgnify:CR=1 FL=1
MFKLLKTIYFQHLKDDHMDKRIAKAAAQAFQNRPSLEFSPLELHVISLLVKSGYLKLSAKGGSWEATAKTTSENKKEIAARQKQDGVRPLEEKTKPSTVKGLSFPSWPWNPPTYGSSAGADHPSN